MRARPPPTMRASWCRWLVAAGTMLALLTAPPRPTAAGGRVSTPASAPSGAALGQGRRVDGGATDGTLPASLSRRLRPNAVAGMYRLFGGQSAAAGGCPRTLTLGSPVRRAGTQPLWMLDFPGESITQDGTRCAGGKLIVIRTLGLVNPAFRSGHGLERVILLHRRRAQLARMVRLGGGRPRQLDVRPHPRLGRRCRHALWQRRVERDARRGFDAGGHGRPSAARHDRERRQALVHPPRRCALAVGAQPAQRRGVASSGGGGACVGGRRWRGRRRRPVGWPRRGHSRRCGGGVRCCRRGGCPRLPPVGGSAGQRQRQRRRRRRWWSSCWWRRRRKRWQRRAAAAWLGRNVCRRVLVALVSTALGRVRRGAARVQRDASPAVPPPPAAPVIQRCGGGASGCSNGHAGPRAVSTNRLAVQLGDSDAERFRGAPGWHLMGQARP